MSEFSANWEGGAADSNVEIFETVHYKFVILGGGNSAGYAARTFAECLDKKTNPLGVNLSNVTSTKDSGNLVAIISAEPVLPYERPALSKAYLNPPGSKVQLRLPTFNTCVGSGGKSQNEAWYKENNITLLLEHEAIDVDCSTQTIICDRRKDRKIISITYEKLIVATGARPLFTNMFEKADILQNIFVLRNEMDASEIVAALQKLHDKPGRAKVMIIGGGYIGMECAAAFSGWNLDVLMVFPEDNLLSRVFTAEISGWYEKYFREERKIEILKNMKVLKFAGEDGKVQKAQLETGELIDIDMALIGIGAVLNVDLFRGQLMAASKQVKGIAVDEFMQTSDPNVYAIGDIAAVPFNRTSKRFEHVDHCRKTADVAVKNILLDMHNYFVDTKKEQVKPLVSHRYLPFFYSRLFEYTNTPVIFNFYGSTGEENEDVEVVQFGDIETLTPTPLGAFWVDKTQRVIGGLLCCAPQEAFAELKDIVVAKKKLSALTPTGAVGLYTTKL